jgi:beta-galactosidase GanA
MLKYGGFCEPFGYGFVQSLYKKYNLDFNFDVKNYNDLPSINAYFYKFKNQNKKNYLALIGISEDQFNNFYKNKYKIIEKKGNCYFLIKND